MDDDIKLPEPVAWLAEYGGDVYTADQLRAAVEADRVQRQTAAEAVCQEAAPAAPQPAAQIGLTEDQLDAIRFRALCEDHENSDIRTAVRELIDRLPVMSLSAARRGIDALFTNKDMRDEQMGTSNGCRSETECRAEN